MEKKLLGKKINLARKDRGMTSDGLSEACNINASYLRQIESGAKMPSLPVFISLCREMKVSPSYLLSDILPEPEIHGSEGLAELCSKATPSQIKLITAMIHSALETIGE